MAQQVAVSQEVFQAMAEYITTRPYREVAQLVEAIKTAKLVNIEEKPPEAPTESTPSDDKQ